MVPRCLSQVYGRGQLFKQKRSISTLLLFVVVGFWLWNWAREKQLLLRGMPEDITEDMTATMIYTHDGKRTHSIGQRLPDDVMMYSSRGIDDYPLSMDVPNNGLWIHVLVWREGMAGWKQSFAELMVAAKRLNATVVEPEIRDGRLVPCGEGNLRLSDVFNRSQFTDFHEGLLASCERYEQARMQSESTMKVVDMCMNRLSNRMCDFANGNVMGSDDGKRESSSLDAALTLRGVHTEKMILLQIHHLWRGGMKYLTAGRVKYEDGRQVKIREPLVDKRRIGHFQGHCYKFLDSHYKFVETHLERHGIDGKYGVVHWRAEVPDMDFESCANQVWHARMAMEQVHGGGVNVPFMLISSLAADVDQLLWGGAREYSQKNRSAHQLAMASLLEKGHHESSSGRSPFLKLDSMLPGLQDSILYAVMDLILVEKAFAFSTCSDQCKRSDSRFNACTKCNHVSKFAHETLAVREAAFDDDDLRTYPCWPSSGSDLRKINNLWFEDD